MKIYVLTFILLIQFAVHSAFAEEASYPGKNCNPTVATRFMGDIKVAKGRGLELKTKFKIAVLSIGDESIADVTPVSARLLRIAGIKQGKTNLIIRYADGYAVEYNVLVDSGFTVEVINGVVTNPGASLVGW